MLPVRTMTPKPTARLTSAAATKIKNKILNTSSFFKVSLKTNNKALALALAAQKERSRQLEKEIVYLQKQVEAMCFELATKKYKHGKLLLILKNLHSNTLQHLHMAADLFSDCDLSQEPEDDVAKSADIDKNVRRLTALLPPQPETTGAWLCPIQTVTEDLREEGINGLTIQNRPIDSTDTFSDKKNDVENQHRGSSLVGTSRPSSSLRDEVERLSLMFSQSGFDGKSMLCFQNSHPPSVVSMCEETQPSTDDAHILSSSVVETFPECLNKQEKTMLLNTTMEMTLTNAAEIVTVETKAKKTGCSGKTKLKKRKERKCAQGEAVKPKKQNGTDCGFRDDQSDFQTVDHTQDTGDSEFIEPQSPKRQCIRVMTSHIPKLSKSEAGSHEKRKKVKSQGQAKSKTGGCDSVSQDLDYYFMEPGNKLLPPFVISVASDSTSSDKASPQEDTVEQSLRSSSPSLHFEAKEPSMVLDTDMNQQHSSPHCDKSLVRENQSSGSPQDVLGSSNNHEVLPLNQGCTSGTDFQKPKKAKRDKTRRSYQKKVKPTEECLGHFTDRKRKKKSSRSDKGLRSEDGANYIGDRIDSPEINKKLVDDLQIVDSLSDNSKIDGQTDHLYDSRPTESKSWMERNPRRYRNTSRHHTPMEARNLRETFVVYRQKPQDRISNRSTRTSGVSFPYSDLMDTHDEAAHENVESMLMDEMPPWLAIDVSTTEMEVGSLLATPRRETSHRMAVSEECGAVTAEASPAGRVLTSLTNTIATPDSETREKTRRRNGVVSYKEPSLNRKIRRGDKFTESTFLSSPVFKDAKKKKKQQQQQQQKKKTTTVSKSEEERSILVV